jgi:hypothetical protein
MSATITTNFDDLKNAAVASIIDGLNGVITGANEDIQNFANSIVQDSMEAAAVGAVDLIPVLEDQAMVLAEKNRIAIERGMEATAFKVLGVALSLVSRIIIPTIPTI